jgi:hypothetical protein
MRKFLIPGMLVLLCAACSNDDFPSDDTATQDSQFTASEGDRYLAVQLLAPNDATTSRAAQPTSTEFDDGLTEESAIDASNIVFYFFDADGNPFSVKSNGDNFNNAFSNAEVAALSLPDNANASGTGSVTWTDDTKNSYITKVSSAMVLLHNPAGVPAQVVAVLNGTFSDKKMTLSELAKTVVTSGYTAATSSTAAPTNFMMTNTVFNDADGVLVQSTKVSTTNLCKTAEAANLNPIQIYVERVVTKVGVDIDDTKTHNGSKDVFMLENTYGDCPGQYSISGTPDDVTVTDADKQLYVKFTGWTTFDEAPSTVALKDITGTYGGVATDYIDEDGQPLPTYDITTDAEISNTWNAPDKYRSYWAFAYFRGYKMDKRIVKYSDMKLAFGEGAGHYSYPFENTSGVISSANGLATKVILAGQLCTYNATTGKYDPYSMCKFMGQTMSFYKFKEYVTNLLTQEGVYMEVEGTDGTKTVRPLTSNDWRLSIHKDSGSTPKSYEVKIVDLWQEDGSLPSNEAYCDAKGAPIAIGEIIASLPAAQFWENGHCYYYTYIQHLNKKNAIIRNHWYTVKINSVTGLGTPYADPGNNTYDEDPDNPWDEHEFDPTRPEDDDWVLGAEIDIEAWRIVGTVADLSSTKDTNDTGEEYASKAPE